MNRFVRDYPDLAWYGFLQDDLHVKTRDWDTRLIEAAGSSGMASSNDLFKGAATHDLGDRLWRRSDPRFRFLVPDRTRA
ncbi:MAG: hypothetical protein WDN48_00115 [Pseudolabrys sp.]